MISIIQYSTNNLRLWLDFTRKDLLSEINVSRVETHFLMFRLVQLASVWLYLHLCWIMSRCRCCSVVSTVAWQQERLWVQIGQECSSDNPVRMPVGICVKIRRVKIRPVEKWSRCGSALNLHLFKWSAGGNSTGCKTKSNFMLWENDTTSCFTYHFSEQFPDEFKVSVANFKFSSIQHDINFGNYGPIKGKNRW